MCVLSDNAGKQSKRASKQKTENEVHEEMCRDDGRDIGGASLCNDKGGAGCFRDRFSGQRRSSLGNHKPLPQQKSAFFCHLAPLPSD